MYVYIYIYTYTYTYTYIYIYIHIYIKWEWIGAQKKNTTRSRKLSPRSALSTLSLWDARTKMSPFI